VPIRGSIDRYTISNRGVESGGKVSHLCRFGRLHREWVVRSGGKFHVVYRDFAIAIAERHFWVAACAESDTIQVVGAIRVESLSPQVIELYSTKFVRRLRGKETSGISGTSARVISTDSGLFTGMAVEELD
jgi:hypothetical protein